MQQIRQLQRRRRRPTADTVNFEETVHGQRHNGRNALSASIELYKCFVSFSVSFFFVYSHCFIRVYILVLRLCISWDWLLILLFDNFLVKVILPFVYFKHYFVYLRFKLFYLSFNVLLLIQSSQHKYFTKLREHSLISESF